MLLRPNDIAWIYLGVMEVAKGDGDDLRYVRRLQLRIVYVNTMISVDCFILLLEYLFCLLSLYTFLSIAS